MDKKYKIMNRDQIKYLAIILMTQSYRPYFAAIRNGYL